MDNQSIEKLLYQIIERLKKLEGAVEQLQREPEPEIEPIQPPPTERTIQLSPQTLLEINSMNLPDSLRKTMMVLAKLKEAAPEEVAKATNRTRGLENIYLNQLERIGYIEKVKKGKRVYFRSLRAISS